MQESGELPDWLIKPDMTEEDIRNFKEHLKENSGQIRAVYPDGVGDTIADFLREDEELQVTSVNMYMPEYGLPDELLDNTDVLIWWAHIAHDAVPDKLVEKVVKRVQKGMGFIALHSSHMSKPFTRLLGTTGTLKWREDDSCKVWTVSPTHPICEGVPECFELDAEEMYGEPFDIAKPDDNIFISWYKGGEVFRSGATWQRGYGKIFYFQPGHETNPSYHNEHVQKIIKNAVHWAAPRIWREKIECPNAI